MCIIWNVWKCFVSLIQHYYVYYLRYVEVILYVIDTAPHCVSIMILESVLKMSLNLIKLLGQVLSRAFKLKVEKEMEMKCNMDLMSWNWNAI